MIKVICNNMYAAAAFLASIVILECFGLLNPTVVSLNKWGNNCKKGSTCFCIEYD